DEVRDAVLGGSFAARAGLDPDTERDAPHVKHLLTDDTHTVLQGCCFDIAESLNCASHFYLHFYLIAVLSPSRPDPARYTEKVTQAIVGLELPDLQQTLGQDQPAFRARQVYDAVYRQKVADLVQITSLPLNLRKELASKISVGLPGLAAEYRSKDGTRRYLMKLQDNRTVEAVLMPEE